MSKKKNKVVAATEPPNGSKDKDSSGKDGSPGAGAAKAQLTTATATTAATTTTQSSAAPMTDSEMKKLASENVASKFAMATMSPGLSISRNKHWRHISSFHGPWLQLPSEVLETLAVINYRHPRPHPVDPAIFFDMVRIRKLVDEASDLAVRAASGTVVSGGNAAHLSSASNVFGIGLKQARTLQLSPERRHRARIDATIRLAEAYAMDEIAASVATMQGASSLEEVAKIVLDRKPRGGDPDPDALYVHFFHEKIPSRQLAESTSLDELDRVIMAHPNDCRHYRTRATVRLFKEDFDGAAADLTEALRLAKMQQDTRAHDAKRERERLGILEEPKKKPVERTMKDKTPMPADGERPSSIEAQLIFYRASVYFDAACHQVYAAMGRPDLANTDEKASKKKQQQQQQQQHSNASLVDDDIHADKALLQEEAAVRQAHAHRLLHINAKKALRDYLAFLRHFHYTPEMPIQVSEAYARKILSFTIAKAGTTSSGITNSTSMALKSLMPLQLSASLLAVSRGTVARPEIADETARADRQWRVFALDELFTGAHPADLPPFPAPPINTAIAPTSSPDAARALLMQSRPTATYHPLVADALHSLLMVYCLLQRPPAELQRHAAMVARLSKASDGYPAFQTTHCTARTDWLDVLRMARETVPGGLSQIPADWEDLSAPPKADKKKRAAAAAARKNAAQALSTPQGAAKTHTHQSAVSNGGASSGSTNSKPPVTDESEVTALADVTNRLELSSNEHLVAVREAVAPPGSPRSPSSPGSPTVSTPPSGDPSEATFGASAPPAASKETNEGSKKKTLHSTTSNTATIAGPMTTNNNSQYASSSDRALAVARWTIDCLNGKIGKAPGTGSSGGGKGKKKSKRPVKGGASLAEVPLSAAAENEPPQHAQT